MGALENRKLIWVLGGLLLLLAAAFGWSLTSGSGKDKKESTGETAETKASNQAKTACASNATYARLKEVAFEEAMRARGAQGASLDTLASHSVVRMEDPVMLSRDEDLNVTVCSGKFILEVPPGAQAGLGGQRRLAADIEYSAQAAADGSGLVYQVRGAEPIVARLAAFNLGGQPLQLEPGARPQDATEYAEAAPLPAPAPAPTPAPAAPRAEEPEPEPAAPKARPAPQPPRLDPAPRTPPRATPTPQPRAERPEPEPTRTVEAEPARRTFSNPSFNCRSARTRGEQMVCGSTSLAARDRAMSSMFYSALASASPSTRAELRRTRDRFLAYRDRCRDEACVADAYQGRMAEIRDIMEAAE